MDLWPIPGAPQHPRKRRPRSLLLLACDGVWDVMTSDGVANMVREALKTRPEASLSDIAKSVVCESYERGSCDNLTVLLARLVGGRGDGVAKVDHWGGGGQVRNLSTLRLVNAYSSEGQLQYLNS